MKEEVKKGRRALGNLIKESLDERDWESSFSRADGPLRLPFFVDNVQLMTDEEYWRLLGDLWTDCEKARPNQRVWWTLFTLPRNGRDKLMHEDERSKFDSLPDEVRLYRATGLKYARGMSWTTNLDVAAYVAQRRPGDIIVTTLAKKRNVLACFSRRGEDEVVIDPRWIRFEALNLSPEGGRGSPTRARGRGILE